MSSDGYAEAVLDAIDLINDDLGAGKSLRLDFEFHGTDEPPCITVRVYGPLDSTVKIPDFVRPTYELLGTYDVAETMGEALIGVANILLSKEGKQ